MNYRQIVTGFDMFLEKFPNPNETSYDLSLRQYCKEIVLHLRQYLNFIVI